MLIMCNSVHVAPSNANPDRLPPFHPLLILRRRASAPAKLNSYLGPGDDAIDLADARLFVSKTLNRITAYSTRVVLLGACPDDPWERSWARKGGWKEWMPLPASARSNTVNIHPTRGEIETLAMRPASDGSRPFASECV